MPLMPMKRRSGLALLTALGVRAATVPMLIVFRCCRSEGGVGWEGSRRTVLPFAGRCVFPTRYVAAVGSRMIFLADGPRRENRVAAGNLFFDSQDRKDSFDVVRCPIPRVVATTIWTEASRPRRPFNDISNTRPLTLFHRPSMAFCTTFHRILG